MKKNALIVAALALIVIASAAAVALLHTGALTQLSGKNGCVARSGSGCSRGLAVSRAGNVIVSADGKNVYVSGGVGSLSEIAAFKRKPTTGALAQLPGKKGCVLFAGYGGGKVCTSGRSIDTPSSLTLSPDGKSLYVAATNSLGVDVFARNASTGVLTQLAGKDGCLTLKGTGGTCTTAAGLGQAAGVAVSADGANVYVAGSAIAAFSRNTATGALTQLPGVAACVDSDGSAPCTSARGLLALRSIALSPDGKSVYVAGGGGAHGSLAVFARNPATGAISQLAGAQGCFSHNGEDGTCTPISSLAQAESIAISPGGTNVYVASLVSSSVSVFARNTGTGALTPLAGTLGCVSSGGSSGKCATGRALANASSVALSRDGKTVYVTATNWKKGGLAVFARNSASGALTQLSGKQGCYGSKAIGCTTVRGVTSRPITSGSNVYGPGGVAVSPNGKSVYEVGGAISIFSRKS